MPAARALNPSIPGGSPGNGRWSTKPVAKSSGKTSSLRSLIASFTNRRTRFLFSFESIPLPSSRRDLSSGGSRPCIHRGTESPLPGLPFRLPPRVEVPPRDLEVLPQHLADEHLPAHLVRPVLRGGLRESLVADRDLRPLAGTLERDLYFRRAILRPVRQHLARLGVNNREAPRVHKPLVGDDLNELARCRVTIGHLPEGERAPLARVNLVGLGRPLRQVAPLC